jgi:hypothetical protein
LITSSAKASQAAKEIQVAQATNQTQAAKKEPTKLTYWTPK